MISPNIPPKTIVRGLFLPEPVEVIVTVPIKLGIKAARLGPGLRVRPLLLAVRGPH